MARANACYLASNCAGSLSGPGLFGLAIDRFGQPSQFLVGGAAVVAVFTLWMLGSAAVRKSSPADAASPGNPPLPVRKIAG
jgi:hypothetical protein